MSTVLCLAHVKCYQVSDTLCLVFMNVQCTLPSTCYLVPCVRHALPSVYEPISIIQVPCALPSAYSLVPSFRHACMNLYRLSRSNVLCLAHVTCHQVSYLKHTASSLYMHLIHDTKTLCSVDYPDKC